MKISANKKAEAYDLLKNYNGNNLYLINLKNNVCVYGNTTLNDFNAEYIINNINFEPILVNKIVKIVDWYGEKKQEDWNLEFTPKVLKIGHLMGETSDHYHVYVKYRQSQNGLTPVFIPKKALITPLFVEEYENKVIDFDKFNKKSGRILKKHQETAIKFLTTRKKAIIADGMGLGKTTSCIVSALEDEYKHVLVICPASVKTNWKKELQLYVNDDDITIVEGSKWRDAKFTVINYDILDNFYEIPTEIVKKRELEVDENGNTKYVYKEKEVVSRKKEVIDKAMNSSQLYKSEFDLIIIDEAHRLSNTTSGRYKIVTDLLKRSNPKGVYVVSGTPITNRPMNLYNMLKLIGADICNNWEEYVRRYCDAKTFFKRDQRDAITNEFLKMKRKYNWNDLTFQEKTELNAVLDKKCKKIWVTSGASNLDELQERIKHLYIRREKEDFNDMVKKKVNVLHYDLTESEKKEYDELWDEYENKKSSEKDLTDIRKYQSITEGIIFRQWLSRTMINRTYKLTKKLIEKGQKVVIFCSFDEELYSLQDMFGDICVIHNGKMNEKKKDKAVDDYVNNDNIKVFIGNITSASVGINLVCNSCNGQSLIFNSFSWVSGDNLQAQDRIHRLNSKNDVNIYYQVFSDTFYDKMYEKVMDKQNIIDNIIIKENEK